MTKEDILNLLASEEEDNNAVYTMLDDIRHAEDARYAELESELEDGMLFHFL